MGSWRWRHSFLHKPRVQGCASGHVQTPVTVLDPIHESGGQPHQSASHASTDLPFVLVVCGSCQCPVALVRAPWLLFVPRGSCQCPVALASALWLVFVTCSSCSWPVDRTRDLWLLPVPCGSWPVTCGSCQCPVALARDPWLLLVTCGSCS